MVQPVHRDETDEQEPTLTAQHSIRDLGKDFLLDQTEIWKSPTKVRASDTQWLVPLGGFTAGLFVTDSDYSRHRLPSPSTISNYKMLSNAGVGALAGAAGGMWLLGRAKHDEHWAETGFLAGEAALNSLVVVESLKYSLRRERPYQGEGSGPFFQSSGTSFPSEHAAMAWSLAGVIAHEYPSAWTKIVTYGLASLVDISRVRAHQHFPSDVVVGSLIGNLVAQNVYSRHHDPGLGGEAWRSISQLLRESQSTPGNQGSPYVPLDSWVYPAFDRLSAMGLIDSGFAGMRPWTRRECARLVNEAGEKLGDVPGENPQAEGLIASLEREFGYETETAGGGDQPAFRVESIYTRVENISGMPLNDGYHFAQTQINDFGRPYGEGWSTVTGFSAYSTAGRWVAYVRGELQTSPTISALPLNARQTIEQVDHLNQLPPDTSHPSVNQVELLDAYVGLTLSNWQLTFGRQSLSWGPGDGGSLMFSDNAAPIEMFRINRVAPLDIPLLSRVLGPMRAELFLGQVRGDELVGGGPSGIIGTFLRPLNQQPMIHGERFSFKPTRNFEFGFSRTALFAGQGIPFTLGTLKHSFFGATNGIPGTLSDPGDTRSGMDWSYRLPKLRDWVTFYGDAFADDEFSPIAYWDRSAIRGGLYFSRLPAAPKLDLRVEGVYTDVPAGGALGHGFYYFNSRFRNGYTSEGNLIGSWIGRQGQGAQAWTNYWFGAKNRLQLNFRHQKVSQEFIPGGGTLTDVGARGDYWVRPNLSLAASVQYERWLFPSIQHNVSRNVAASIQILFEPRKSFSRLAGSAPRGTP